MSTAAPSIPPTACNSVSRPLPWLVRGHVAKACLAASDGGTRELRIDHICWDMQHGRGLRSEIGRSELMIYSALKNCRMINAVQTTNMGKQAFDSMPLVSGYQHILNASREL